MSTATAPPSVFAPVSSQVDFPAMEEEILAFWNERDLYRKSVDNRPAERPFRFYDGPPFATGLPHYGHLLASISKDVVPRYWTMRGYRVERRWGWDCHGLPVENEAESQLGLKTRADIIEYGIGPFNEYCRQVVLRYTAEWQTLIQRLGRWVDWDHQYRTMDTDFMESVWWVFKSLWDKGLIYQGFKSLAYCPRCATPLSNFEVNLGYQDTQDPSITVRFRVRGTPGLSILAWTTTPWTLPSNMALAVGSDIDYVRVTTTDGESLILARSRLDAVFGKRKAEIASVAEQPVAELLTMSYEPLFGHFAELRDEGAFRVVAADFVSTDDGTGIVHIAPGFGEDDHLLGQRAGIPVICPIDADCCFTDEVAEYAGQVRQGRRHADHPRPARGRHPVLREHHRPQLPVLLALRRAADLPHRLHLVRPGRGRSQGTDAGRQPPHPLGPGAHPRRPLRQVAGRRARLGDQPQPLLGHAAADLARRGDRRSGLRRQHPRAPGADRPAGGRPAQAPHRRPGDPVAGRRWHPAPHPGGARLLVRVGVDAVRTEPLPVRAAPRTSRRAFPPTSSPRTWTRRAAGSTRSRCWRRRCSTGRRSTTASSAACCWPKTAASSASACATIPTRRKCSPPTGPTRCASTC